MSIVNSYIGRDQAQPSGMRSVHEYHVDHTGKTHRFINLRPADFDVAQAMADRAAALPAHLAQNELEDALSRLEDGESPAAIVLDHQSRRKVVIPLVKAVMRLDTRKALRIAKFIDANISDASIVMEFSVAVRTRVKARITGLLAVETALDDDTAKIEDIR